MGSGCTTQAANDVLRQFEVKVVTKAVKRFGQDADLLEVTRSPRIDIEPMDTEYEAAKGYALWPRSNTASTTWSNLGDFSESGSECFTGCASESPSGCHSDCLSECRSPLPGSVEHQVTVDLT